MEESEKRRERLRAMRMEAAQADVANYAETSLPNYLSNPLVESSATMVGQPEPCTAPRFDYYTNRMSAFYANKERGKFDNKTVSDNYVPSHHNNSPATYVPSHQNNSPATYVPSYHNNSPATYGPSNFPGLRNPELSPSPTHQFPQHSPDQRTFYARGFRGSGGHGSPAMPRPFPIDQGTPDMRRGPRSPFVNHFPGHPPRGMSSPSLVSRPRGNSYTNPTQDRVNYHSPSPIPGYQGSSSPGGGSHGHRGRGNMSPSPRFGSGRSVGSHGRHFSSDKSPIPEQFYNASMLEDPWKVLQPGIWKTIAPLSSCAKFGMKKARVSDSFSGPSLAEYMAASFNETVNDAPSV